MSREKPKKINLLPVLGLPGCFVFLAEKLSGDEHPFMAGRMVV